MIEGTRATVNVQTGGHAPGTPGMAFTMDETQMVVWIADADRMNPAGAYAYNVPMVNLYFETTAGRKVRKALEVMVSQVQTVADVTSEFQTVRQRLNQYVTGNHSDVAKEAIKADAHTAALNLRSALSTLYGAVGTLIERLEQ